mmetsp:Transcript_22775/g.52705  ORF Transcript_22775/g.52705 Transcript_22775/m.52705 type:complete len:356 (+) Transcript_22775:3-1070(+)
MLAGREPFLEKLKELAQRGIHPLEVMQSMRKPMQEEKMDAVLPSFDLEGIARYIADKGCKKIIVMCGAGISTSAGIPDFRTPGTGLYDNLQRFDLPRAESIFELDFFRANPGAFYELARDMWPGNYEPTPAHYFIRLLHDKGILSRCYSQNIDSLECRAGLPAEKLVAAHGNFDAAHVIDKEPEQLVDIKELKAALDVKGEEGWRKLQEEKGGLVKPKIVFFGEELPERFASLHRRDLADCDLLIVMGTSLVVHPFAGLVGYAGRAAPRMLINRDPAGTCDDLRFGFRFHMEGDQNWRDVFHKGDCDSGCRALAEALGWKADLDALIDSKGTASVPRAPWAELDGPEGPGAGYNS